MSEWTDTPVTLIVATDHVELARALCAALAEGGAGQNMLTTPLSPTGEGEPTHYGSSGQLWRQFVDLLADPQAIFDAAGGQVPLATIEAMLAASTIRVGENPHAVLAELGLVIVSADG
jgi:hypothetical protein